MPVPLFNPKDKLHCKMALIVKSFISQGREWARRKMEASSSLSKAQLETDYQDTITKIDALAALIYKLTREEFITTLSAHPKLERSYHKKTLSCYNLLA